MQQNGIIKNFKKRAEKELAVLLYHGVTNEKSKGIENYSYKHIHEEDFVRQMQFIRENCTVLSINDVVEIKRNGDQYPFRPVLVTFDDGFRNNYTTAAPMLEQYNIPAVFYITAGIVNTTIMFWVDILEDCINLTDKKSLRIMLDDLIGLDLSTNKKKIESLEKVKSYCKRVSHKDKDRIVNELISATGIQPSVDHSNNYRKISWCELIELHNNDLFTVGGHSLYHNILTRLDPDILEKDIELSISLLEFNLAEKVIHYAYPEGQEDHYDNNIIHCLKQHGIVCCPSAVNGLNNEEIDLFNLHRIMVGFMGEEFPYW